MYRATLTASPRCITRLNLEPLNSWTEDPLCLHQLLTPPGHSAGNPETSEEASGHRRRRKSTKVSRGFTSTGEEGPRTPSDSHHMAFNFLFVYSGPVSEAPAQISAVLMFTQRACVIKPKLLIKTVQTSVV